MKFDNCYDAFSYLSSGLDAESFARICDANIEYFTDYLEAIIDNDGKIYFAQPSHQEMLKKIALTKDSSFTDKDIPISASPCAWIMDRFNLVSIRYNYINIPRMITRQQINSIKVLLSHDLIADYSEVKIEDEYIRCKYIDENNIDALAQLSFRPKYDSIKNLVMNCKITIQNTL